MLNGGFKSLNSPEKITMVLTNDKYHIDAPNIKTQFDTPRQAIDYLLEQLLLVLKRQNTAGEPYYNNIILPCALNSELSKQSALQASNISKENFTLGNAIFSPAEEVKTYIYNAVCAITNDKPYLLAHFLMP